MPRYLEAESTNILGAFNSGDSVTIDIYDLSDDSLVVSGASASEVGTTGVFKYSFAPAPSTKTEYLWIMDNGSMQQKGKIILGGFPDDILTDTDEIQGKLPTNYIMGSSVQSDKDDEIDQIKAVTDRIIGLSQENYRVFNTEHDFYHNLKKATIRIYPTAADVENDTNHIAEYTISADYDNQRMTEYKVKKVG